MSDEPRKRSSAGADDDPIVAKRQRLGLPPNSPTAMAQLDGFGALPSAVVWHCPDWEAKAGLDRAIALALDQVGFDGAKRDAMVSFTAVVEEYMASFIAEVKLCCHAARREMPTPVDFAQTLRRFNLPVSSLKVHLKHPIPESRLATDFHDPVGPEPDTFEPLPLLGDDLSGQPEKEAKSYIPDSFPDFPSIHTYKYTPREDIEGRSQHKMREDAAKAAKQGEEALRRLVRAAKIRQQKEVRSSAEKDARRKERHSLWETAMADLMQETAGEQSVEMGETEIADHSMIVNAEAGDLRTEVPRFGKRIAQGEVVGKG